MLPIESVRRILAAALQNGGDRVSLLDNGRLPGGLGTRPFDDEGVPTSATKLIDEGGLQAVLHDSYSASRGSHRGVPGLSASNFYFQPGPEDPDAIIAGVERDLYVENVMNTASINPVNEVTIAISMQNLLHNVSAVGNDLTFVPFMGAIGSPTFRVDGVMIGGK